MLTVFASVSLSGRSSQTFVVPGAVLLFGTYDELRLAAPEKESVLTPPVEISANHGYFAFPSLGPAGQSVAWGFAHRLDSGRATYQARYSLGIYSVATRTWATFGDFDHIGPPAFSRDGSKVAVFVGDSVDQGLFVLDTHGTTLTHVPHDERLPFLSVLSWSPNDERLAVQMARAEKPPQIGVLDLTSGELRPLAEGRDPRWSPTGEWIAYTDSSGLKCWVIHPDGSGARALKDLGGGFLHTLLFGYREFLGGQVWSPDGSQLLLNESKGDGPNLDVMRLDLATGRSERMSKNGLAVFGWATLPKVNTSPR